MKKIAIKKFSDRLLTVCPGSFRRWLLPVLFIILLKIPASAQKNIQVPEFEVLDRQPLSEKGGILGIGANNKVAIYQPETREGKPKYTVTAKGAAVSIDALSGIEYAEKADRIVTYGDSPDRHVVSNMYVRFYTGTGTLVKSLGLVATWPFVAALSDNGLFIMAGNKSKAGGASMALFLYDKNGIKLWEKALPDQAPTKVIIDQDNKYIAVELFDLQRMSGIIRYYNTSGNLLFTNSEHGAISGIEFLPSNKVVVCTGNLWFLHDMSPSFKLLAKGVLKGNALGRYPVSAHPSKDIFFVVTTGGPSSYMLQAYNASDGRLMAESEFEGEPFWESYRLANVSADGTVKLITSREVVTLKMK